MEYYLLLTLETTVIAALALRIWLRTGHVGFPVGIGLLYFWSLHGAWSIITDSWVGRVENVIAICSRRCFRSN